MSDCSRSASAEKPAKPYPDFPLYAHQTKRWAKKIKGRTHFFGPWNDWQSAFARYQHEAPYLHQGKRPPPQEQPALSVADLVNHFLEHRAGKLASGEIMQITFDDYRRAGIHVVESMGRYTDAASLEPGDFAKLRARLASRYAPTALGPQMQRCRAIFNFGWKNALLDRPAKMGVEFDKPSRKSVTRHKQTRPAKIFAIDELKSLYAAAGRQMQAFILLGLNGGMGNTDVGRLEFRHIQNDWIVYPRHKTGVLRSFPLWPETVQAIREAQQSGGVQPYVFLTKYGRPWFRDDNRPVLAPEFKKLAVGCGVHQTGRGFYSLRHQFRTVADGCRDTPAIDHVMGHTDSSMGANYREWIEPVRLQAVVDFVRAWAMPILEGVK